MAKSDRSKTKASQEIKIDPIQVPDSASEIELLFEMPKSKLRSIKDLAKLADETLVEHPEKRDELKDLISFSKGSDVVNKIITKDDRGKNLENNKSIVEKQIQEIKSIVLDEYIDAKFILNPSQDIPEGFDIIVRVKNYPRDFSAVLFSLVSQVQANYQQSMDIDVYTDYGRI